MTEEEELIDIREVCRELGGSKPLHPATVYRAILRGDVDPPLHPTPGASRWIRGRIRARARGGATTKK
jgi:hypothetical protein